MLGSSSVSLGLVQSVLAHHNLLSPTMILDWAQLRHFLTDLWHRSTRARGMFNMYPEQQVNNIIITFITNTIIIFTTDRY